MAGSWMKTECVTKLIPGNPRFRGFIISSLRAFHPTLAFKVTWLKLSLTTRWERKIVPLKWGTF
jgi:hypothetical protein